MSSIGPCWNEKPLGDVVLWINISITVLRLGDLVGISKCGGGGVPQNRLRRGDESITTLESDWSKIWVVRGKNKNCQVSGFYHYFDNR